jgi:deoxycytidine triphosphate deaminase
MHLCDRSDVLKLIHSGQMTVDNQLNDVKFLDEHRLALHLTRLYEVQGSVDLSAADPPYGRHMEVETAELVPGGFYLGITRERLSFGQDIAASLHTRSRYARLGLEVLCSSNFVVPGFGATGPAPLVFEITVRRRTFGLNSDASYCFALIYQISSPRRQPNVADYNTRFPIPQLT